MGALVASADQDNRAIQMPNNTNDDQRVSSSCLLTDTEAAQYLNVSVSSIRKWRLYGRGPDYCKFNSAVRYRMSDLQRFIEAAKVSAQRNVN